MIRRYGVFVALAVVLAAWWWSGARREPAPQPPATTAATKAAAHVGAADASRSRDAATVAAVHRPSPTASTFGLPGIARIVPATAGPRPMDDAAMIDADIKANQLPNPLPALKKLAAEGNPLATNDVGARLTQCIPEVKRQDRIELRRRQRVLATWQAAQARLKRGPATAASVAAAQQAVSGAKTTVAWVQRRLKNCRGVTPDAAWAGLDWFRRAYAMGYRFGLINEVGVVVAAYHNPSLVGRDPQRALAMRTRVRARLKLLLSHCDETSLLTWAQFEPLVYDLADYQRYLLLVLQQQLRAAMSGEPDADAHAGALGAKLGSARRARAVRQARRLRAQCLGHEVTP